MTQSEKATSVKEGQIYESFYSDGTKKPGMDIVTKVSVSSIFTKSVEYSEMTEQRVSRNTFQTYLDKGIKKLVTQ